MSLSKIIEEVKEEERKYKRNSNLNLMGLLTSVGVTGGLILNTSRTDSSPYEVLSIIILNIVSLEFLSSCKYWRDCAKDLRETYPNYFDKDKG